MKLSQVIKHIKAEFPLDLAESWDPVGLQLGDLGAEIKSVLTAVDLTPSVLQEALQQGCDLILLHHPFIFEPLKHLRFDSPKAKMIQQLIKNDIAVYAVHTSADNVVGGINQSIADLLGLKSVRVLAPSLRATTYKLAVYVPEDHAAVVHEALSQAGAGTIGNYAACAFQIKGTGTFTPLKGSQPAIGAVGKAEYVEEIKLEMEVPKSKLSAVLQALEQTHPYEEVAYDLYGIEKYSLTAGGGRVGKLATTNLKALAETVKERLQTKQVRIVQPHNSKDKIQTVAICCGSGFSFFSSALVARADVFITGDLKHHDALKAQGARMALIDIDHYECEKIVKTLLIDRLSPLLDDVTMQASVAEASPFECL